MNWWIQNSALSTIVWLQCGIRIVKAKLKTKQKNHFALGQPVTLLHYWSIHWIYWNQIHKTKYQNPKYFLLCKWKFNKFFIQQALEGLKFQNKQTQKQMIQTFDRGNKKTEGEKKSSFLIKCIQKSNVIKKSGFYALSFYKSQNFLCRSKCFKLVQKFNCI